MKDLNNPAIDRFRDRREKTREILRHNVSRMGILPSTRLCGVFHIPSPIKPSRYKLKVIASSGSGWDRVSVSLGDRTPVHEEMDYIKRLFFDKDEVAFQLHLQADDQIDFPPPNVLTLWRPHMFPIPIPPQEMQ